MLVDLHLPVDSLGGLGSGSSLSMVLDQAREKGLDGICFSRRRWEPDTEWQVLEEMAAPLKVFLSIELLTELGPLLWLPPRIEQAQALMGLRARPDGSVDAERAIGEAGSTGGAVVATQPLVPDRPREQTLQLLRSLGIHALEVFNAGRSEQENRAARRAARRFSLVGVGGSGGLAALGKVATLFGSPLASQAALVRALHQRNAWAVALLS